MNYYSAFLWEKNGRDINEDSLSINQVMINGQPLLMGVVCDGIGSLSDGELASSFVVSSLKTQFKISGRERNLTLRRIESAICRQLYSCHEELKQRNTGTTVCVVIIYKKQSAFLCIGDSRIYAGRKKLKLLSRDTVDNNGRLTAAIGVGTYKGIQRKYRRFGKNTMVLLCTDGFYRRNEAVITEKNCFMLRKCEDRVKDSLRIIYENAVEKGEKDNASAVAIWRER